MDRGLPELRQLDFGRLASLRIRITAALVFRSQGLPGKDELAARQQDAVLALIFAGSSIALSETAAPLGAAVRRALNGFFNFVFSGHTSAAAVLSKRITEFRQAIDNFECPHCSHGNDASKCVAEFLELLEHTQAFAADAYLKAAGDKPTPLPQVFLEIAPHHAHQTTDILDIAAVTGTCRYQDVPNPTSIVGLGIKDDAFSWSTMCQLPYVLMHELLCHAFQGLRGAHRRPVDSSCAWSEGWMDALALMLTERWLRAHKSKIPKWVEQERAAILEESSRLHKRRREPQNSIQPHVLDERIAAHDAAWRLERAYQGKSRRRIHAAHRLFRFSLRLNLHSMSQKDRGEMAERLGLALELFNGERLDRVIAACERFVEHDDWQALRNELESLMNLIPQNFV